MKKFLNRWDRLSFRLPLLIVLAAIATGSVTLWLAVSGASDTFITQRKERMELVRNERERAIQSMFKNVRNDLGVLAVRASTVRDLRELSADLRSLSEEKRKALIAAFVDNNPYPTGSREALDDPGDGSAYAKHHKEVHNFYRQYIQIQGYYDIYLVDAYGNVVYNVSKESDFGTNLLSGPYHEDAAAEVFRKAVTAVPPWDAVFADMKMYPPSNGPALFMGQAVRDSDGTVIGAILLQMNVAELKATANHIQDLGESGEVYLVGPDQILRSETRFMKDVLLKRKMETEGARRSAAGFEGSSVNKDYLGNEVIAAYGPIDIMGVRWGIVSKVDLAEVLGPLRNLTQRTIVGTLLATTLIALFGYFLARRISRPLERALYAMNRLSQGQLNFDIDIGGGAAETRQIADALKVFQANLIETDNLVKTVKQTQAQTAAILDNSPIGVIVLGLNDEVLFVNDPGASVLGRQPDLMVGQPFSFDDMAMLSSSWAALVSAVRKNGQVRDADFDLRVHEKGVVSLVLTVQKTTFSGKEGYLVWFQDVTAQKQAREELRALSTRFVAFLESTPDLVSIKDTEGRYQAASQSLATFAGVRSWRDFLGKKSQDMFPPEIGRARDALDVEILKDGKSQIEIEEHIEIRGREVWLATKRVALSAPNGSTAGVLNISRDITAKKEADDALAAALRTAEAERSKSQIILDAAPDPIVIVRKDRRIEYVNQRFIETFGYQSAEIVGKEVETLLPQRYRDRHQGLVKHFFNASISRVMGAERELFAQAKDGREIPVEISLSPINYGEDVRVAASLHDITDRKAAEIALREAKAAAEAATAAKGNFLASMSHEIRTPMNGITGMADLLSQTSLDDDQQHMLKTIRDSGNSLITIINDILDFSKIEAGKLSIEDVSMSIVDAVEGVASTLTPNARSKGIKIHTFVDPELPASVQGDPVRLRQILFNLTGNGVKFSDKKDVMLRALPLAKPGSTDSWVRFEIIDRGIGISLENQAKLFQAFSQAESSTTRKFGGTGLGLVICKRLVELMGGHIGVTSKEGEGSTFWVELPLVPTEESRSHEKPRDLKDLRVVLLGSVEPRRAALIAYLRHWGAEALPVDDAGAASKLLEAAKKAGSISSIVIDLDLDDARQSAAVADLRDKQGKKPVPMIVLQDYQKRGARVSAQDVVTVDANPLIRYRFVTAVAVAAGRASPQVRTDDEVLNIKPKKAPTVDEALAAGQLILLAEDNLTNQDVIRRQLNLLGYTCEIANHGVEALAAWRIGRYALLLTDCHMPEMDGYELTGEIRKAERDKGKRLPIIAVTANALQGEAERCLAAGMDDYISKPIAMTALQGVLKKWMPAATPRQKADGKMVSGRPPVNDRAIKDMFGDDDVTFKEILTDFLPASRGIVQEIVTAATARDAGGVSKAAHKLKSAARSVGADALADVCVTLESAGKANDLDTIAKHAAEVEPLMAAVAAYIEAL